MYQRSQISRQIVIKPDNVKMNSANILSGTELICVQILKTVLTNQVKEAAIYYQESFVLSHPIHHRKKLNKIICSTNAMPLSHSHLQSSQLLMRCSPTWPVRKKQPYYMLVPQIAGLLTRQTRGETCKSVFTLCPSDFLTHFKK